MARHPSWMVVESEGPDPAGRGWLVTFRLARLWWARPSFWICWLRTRGMR